MSNTGNRIEPFDLGCDWVPLPVSGGAPFITRFAPSPTGFLHIGHAYSALFAYESAHRSGGRFLLRMEDVDTQRCRSSFDQAIRADLQWLGLRWNGAVRHQSSHFNTYAKALGRLRELGVVYPCFCTRQQIRSEIEAADHAPHGPSGELIYPGTCRDLSPIESDRRSASGHRYAWRLNVEKAIKITGRLTWSDCRQGEIVADPQSLGDVVLARKDTPTSYHLAVTVDDHVQRINLVTRGQDLFHATHIHRLLQALLGFQTPQYYHHNLIVDAKGERLAKRNQAQTIRFLRERGRKPDEIWSLLGLSRTELRNS